MRITTSYYNYNFFIDMLLKKFNLKKLINIRFRSAVKEMEVMMINVINSTFETVTYVEQGVEILDAFMHLSAREVC